MTTRRSSAIWVLFGVSALWGISFSMIGHAVQDRPVGDLLVFLVLRFSLASLAFLPIAGVILRAARGRGATPWLHAAFIGVLLFVSFLMQSIGLTITTPARSAFVTLLSVPLVPFIAALHHRRAPSLAHVGGSLAAVLGVGLVLAPDGAFQPNAGDWWTLGCAVVFAVEIVALEHVTRRSPTSIVAFGQIATVPLCAALCLPLVPLFAPHELPELTATAWPGLWPAVFVTGILCTTLALGMMTWAQARVRAEIAAVIFALEPVFAVLFDYGYAGGTLTAWQCLGGAVVVLAVILSSRAPVPGAEPSVAPGSAPR